MRNLKNQTTDTDCVNATAIKQEIGKNRLASDTNIQSNSERLHAKIMNEPTSSVVNKKQSLNVISDRVGAVNTHTAIKMEKGFDFQVFPYPNNNNSVTVGISDKKFHIKEEVCDTSMENISSMNGIIQSEKVKIKKESEKSPHKSQAVSKKKKRDIEKVFFDEQQSTDVDIKDAIVKEEEIWFQIIDVKDSASCRDAFDKTVSVAPLGCTDNITPSSASPLELHERASTAKKPENGNNKLMCDICPRSFRHKAKLKAHMKSHTAAGKEKDKMCEICGRTYAQNSALQKHLKFTHSNYRPFACEICGRAFKDSNGLKVHIRSHSGEVRILFLREKLHHTRC